MPEYLAPGVYVEEVSFRSKSIEGVSTTTTGFIGPTAFGPLDLEPDVITSLGEFELIYGNGDQLDFQTNGGVLHNYMWHAVRAFFGEGGKRLYIARVFLANSSTDDGRASVKMPTTATADADAFFIRSRFPGKAGNLKATFTLSLSPNILGKTRDPITNTEKLSFSGLTQYDIVFFRAAAAANDRVATAIFDPATNTFKFEDTSVSPAAAVTMPATPPADPTSRPSLHIITLNLTLELPSGATLVYSGLSPDPRRVRGGQPESLFNFFSEFPTDLAIRRTVPIFINLPTLTAPATTSLINGQAVLKAVYDTPTAITAAANAVLGNTPQTPIVKQLTGGNDGKLPSATEYEGKAELTSLTKTGLKQFEDIEDISILAAPGATAGYEKNDTARGRGQSINNLLIAHAQYMRYRIAVLDSGEGQTIVQVRAMRSQMDSKWAAIYYPWVRVFDPITRQQIYLPPSGFISGIYARNDINRAVYKAPANEVVTLSIGFEQLLNKAQQEILNPEGVNCLRFFEGRGYLVWGARTISSDPEWKYVNLRRYFAYLERSIERGTQWAVFEPNGERLWANVRTTIEDFLLNEWQNGALLGDKPEKAYFVRCDRSTMTQNDLDNGRLVCLIGVAALRPAEFVIFRIGQWTADRKS
jgi:hypothetical protein